MWCDYYLLLLLHCVTPILMYGKLLSHLIHPHKSSPSTQFNLSSPQGSHLIHENNPFYANPCSFPLLWIHHTFRVVNDSHPFIYSTFIDWLPWSAPGTPKLDLIIYCLVGFNNSCDVFILYFQQNVHFPMWRTMSEATISHTVLCVSWKRSLFCVCGVERELPAPAYPSPVHFLSALEHLNNHMREPKHWTLPQQREGTSKLDK